MSVRPRPFVQAANGIDSIKRRGNEESEGEAAARRLPSRQRGEGAWKEAEVQGHHVFHKKVFRDHLNYPSITPFGNALKTPVLERKQDTGISCRATRPTDLLFLVSLARRKTATGNKSEEREGGTLQRECLLFLPSLPCPALPICGERSNSPPLPLPPAYLSLLLSKK